MQDRGSQAYRGHQWQCPRRYFGEHIRGCAEAHIGEFHGSESPEGLLGMEDEKEQGDKEEKQEVGKEPGNLFN